MKRSAYRFLLDHKDDNLFLKNIFQRFNDEQPLNIDDIAIESYISKSGITRFFKNHGFDGFKGFKYLLLNESAELMQSTSIEDFENEIIYEPIQVTASLNPKEKFLEVIDLLLKARIINIVGIGGNHSPAYELTTRLKKFGFNVFHHFEFRDTLLSISNLNNKDLVFIFSYSGETDNVIQAAHAAKTQGLKIVAVTSREDSTLAKLADVILKTDASDNLLRVMPLKSRISMLYLVFKLANYIYEQDHEKYAKIFLEKMYN